MENHKYVLVYVEPPKDDSPHSPTLETLHRVERILRSAAARDEGPLSLAEIARRLPAKKVRRETVHACLDELARFHLVARGEKGAMWVLAEDDSYWNRATVPLR